MNLSFFQTLIGTSKGWIIRQGIKYAALAGGAVSSAIITAASSLPVDPTQAAEIAAKSEALTQGGVTLGITIVLALLEGYLSQKASKIAAQ
jgi:hypothetical protein